LALAEATVLFAEALGFDHLALHAGVFLGGSSTGAHWMSISPAAVGAKVPEVTAQSGAKHSFAVYGSKRGGTRMDVKIGGLHVIEIPICIDLR
jgi:hypothetical protein